MKNHPLHKNKSKVYHKAPQSTDKNKKDQFNIEESITALLREGKTFISHLRKQAQKADWYKELLKEWKEIKPLLKKQKKALLHFIKRRESDFQLLLFPSILLFILLSVTVINNSVYNDNRAQELPTDSMRTKINPYPFVDAIQTPEITAQAAIIIDRSSQVILYSKNPQLRFSMASTTKIMTALTGLDYYGNKDVLTVKSVGVEGSGLGLRAGDQFYFEDLLYMMLLPSANDAAKVIADNYPGGEKAFVQKMNEKAKALQLKDTHFADPTGLDDDGDYTTAVDLARLASQGIANPKFVEITSSKYKTVSSLRYGGVYQLQNLNTLLGEHGVTGIKTGTTEAAGQVLVTSTIKKGKTFVIVVLHSQNRFSDTGLLLQHIDEHVKYINPGEELPLP